MANKQPLSKEDIQVLAMELNKLQQAEKSSEQTSQHERTNALKCERKANPTNQPSDNKSANKTLDVKSIGSIVVILIWAIVFVILAIKLAPYL